MDDLLSIAVSNAVAAAVLALAAVGVGAVSRRPALVHGLWLLVLLKLVTPPLVFIPVAWPTAAESPALDVAATLEEPTLAPPPAAEEDMPPVAAVAAGERGCVSSPREVSTEADLDVPPNVDPLGVLTQSRSPIALEAPSWPQILQMIWGVGALAWFVLVMERVHHFRRLLRFARPAPAAIQERTRRLAQALGLKYCPRVRLLPGRVAPMLWAVGGPPRLLVPADLLDLLSEEQLDTLLVHELAHLRRRDHWVRVLEFVVMGLYWWHPVVWYARRELREAEEQCCDAWVVSTLPGTGRTYASALLDTLDFLSTVQTAVPPLASGLGQIADLKRRLTMIMQGNTPRSLTWPGCLAVIALGLTVLPMLPSLQGQPPATEEEREEIKEAQKELEKAKRDLDRQMADLARKMRELARAEQQAARESVRKALTQVDKSQIKDKANKAAKRNASIRIEITLPTDENVKPNDIVQRIRKAMPENLRDVEIALHVGPTAQQLQKPKAPPGAMPPTPPAPPVPPAARPGGQNFGGRGSGSRSSETRINELEKRLEKMLEELQELRKQMKQPRGGNYRAPEGEQPTQALPTPAAPVPPPPPGAVAPRSRFRLVPNPDPPPAGYLAPVPAPRTPAKENPYHAPTVPLAPSTDPA